MGRPSPIDRFAVHLSRAAGEGTARRLTAPLPWHGRGRDPRRSRGRVRVFPTRLQFAQKKVCTSAGAGVGKYQEFTISLGVFLRVVLEMP
jgi:hypothetical protein